MPLITLPTRKLINRQLTLVELLYNNTDTTPAIVAVELDSRSVQFSEDVTTLTTEGTTDTHEKDITNRFSIILENQVWSDALDKIGMAKQGTDGTRFHTGKAPSGNYGLRLTFEAEDEDTGAAVKTQRTFYRIRQKRYQGTTDPQRQQVPVQRSEFNAVKASTDLLGVAIADAPTGGAYYGDKEVA